MTRRTNPAPGPLTPGRGVAPHPCMVINRRTAASLPSPCSGRQRLGERGHARQDHRGRERRNREAGAFGLRLAMVMGLTEGVNDEIVKQEGAVANTQMPAVR